MGYAESRDVFVVRSALESLAVILLCGREDREKIADQLWEALAPLEQRDRPD